MSSETQLVAHLKKVLAVNGVKSFESFDPTFMEFFESSIKEGDLSRDELSNMLQALCPELLDLSSSQNETILSTVIDFVNNGGPMSPVTESIVDQLQNLAISDDANPSSKSEDTVEIDGEDEIDQLVYYEATLISNQIKQLFSQNDIVSGASFEVEVIITLIELVKQSDNRELNLDIVSDYFPSISSNKYILDQLIRILKSSRLIGSKATSSSTQSKTSSSSAVNTSPSTLLSGIVDSSQALEELTLLKNHFPFADDDSLRYVYYIICDKDTAETNKFLYSSQNHATLLQRIAADYQHRSEEQRKDRKLKSAVARQFAETEVLATHDEKGRRITRPAVVFMSTVGGGNQKVRLVYSISLVRLLFIS